VNASPRRRSGFTLIEMIAVMWGLTAALGLGMALILAAVRTDQVAAATLGELSRRGELADQFRGDVARAEAAPEKFGEWTAGPTCLILRAPGDTYVVYRGLAGKVERIIRTGDKESRRPILVGNEETAVEFIRPAGERPLVTLLVNDSPVRGVVRRTDMSAVLGGDRR
jgi:type II secretory pathway pseudopilin PulG